jgi:integrase
MRETGYLAVTFAAGNAGELLKLKWENVDMGRGSITIIQSKTLRRKTIAINEPARDALNWLQANRYGNMFMWPWGDPIGKVTVYDAFRKPVARQKSTISASTT